MSREKPTRLLAEERRREIQGVLDHHGRITVEEVMKRFGVSAVTARGDLDTLSQSGALVRSHGGGVRPQNASPEYPLLVRTGIRRAEKARIARAALALIRPLETIIVCTGSTSAELAMQLCQNPVENIKVISYALNVATKLAQNPRLSLIMIGGELRQPSTAFVGPQAEEMMRSLHADHCFMSTVGLHLDVGLTTLDMLEAQLNRRMIESSAQVTVLADSSKFGQRSLAVISDLKPITRVITDAGAPPGQVTKLRDRGIEVVLV